ncbi:helix-turn-helix domain-containing protein [Patescibacteria group bacterium]|nr:helix-turn-helix domain-containing protein [Patescibacteria group bacterium]
MLTATLGGLIKDYRIKKRLSQLEVSLRIGWKDTSRLSKIEQGRVGKPTRPTVDKIIKALELTDQEAGEFLFIGGYMPSDDECMTAIAEVKARIDSWPTPAYLVDFTWRVIYINKPTAEVLGFPLEFIKQIPKLKPNLLEYVLSSGEAMPVKIYKGDDEGEMKSFPEAMVNQFKVEQLGRENDAWFKKLIHNLAKHEIFRQLWSNADISKYHKKLLDYEYKVVEGTDALTGKPKTYKFHIFASRLINDQRFQVLFYMPAK